LAIICKNNRGWLLESPFICLAVLFCVLGCVPKKNYDASITSMRSSEEKEASDLATLSGENSHSSGQESRHEDLQEEIETDNPETISLPPVEEQLIPAEETITPPQELLETALDACTAARSKWKNGDLEEALAELDEAYALILAVDTERWPDLYQQKEDLRYLISKRIVEIHASRRATVGDTSKSIPLVMNDHVMREIKSFQNREREFFISSYKRAGRYRPMILEALREEGLPEQLSWLPLIESGFKTNALSRARALGLWQFISSTGYRYGLKRDQWVDERMDPEKATGAAIRYLVDLHGLFGDWMSALAGYNCGEGRVLRAIKNQRINYLDNFWDLYEQLPRETARYVPRFIATLTILQDPAKYGFDFPEPNPEPPVETVTVARSVKLSSLDDMLSIENGSMKALNPELRYGVTPGKAYQLRVPAGTGAKVIDTISDLPQWEVPADSYITHMVRRGETLGAIARKYGASTKRIVTANRLRSEHRIWPGQKLKIPGSRSGTSSLVAQSSGPGTHKVVSGDSLWVIAKKYRVSVNNLKKWNQLSGTKLNKGQVLKVAPPGSKKAGNTAIAGKKDKVYRVRSGDTLDKIAKRHGISLTALLRANNLDKKSTIFPKQQLVVPQ